MADDEFRGGQEQQQNEGVPPPASGKRPNGEAPEDREASTLPGAGGRRARAKTTPEPEPEPPPSPEYEPRNTIDPNEIDEEADYRPIETKPGGGPNGETTHEDLDEDAAEFEAYRRDTPNVHGSADKGIVTITVAKAPPKNQFFRAHRDFHPKVNIVVDEVGLEHKYYAVHPDMEDELRTMGIAFAEHTLYLIITPVGALRIIPVRCPDSEGPRNDYASTKELALVESMDAWLRIYTDIPNKCYRRYPAPEDRFPEPIWPRLSHAKIFRLGFRDRDCLIHTPEHPRVLDWAAKKAKTGGA
jgi:hypothetical protein